MLSLLQTCFATSPDTKNIVSEVVVNDTVNVIFHNSPRWGKFECDIKFNSELTPEEQILLAFDVR